MKKWWRQCDHTMRLKPIWSKSHQIVSGVLRTNFVFFSDIPLFLLFFLRIPTHIFHLNCSNHLSINMQSFQFNAMFVVCDFIQWDTCKLIVADDLWNWYCIHNWIDSSDVLSLYPVILCLLSLLEIYLQNLYTCIFSQ